MFRPLLVAALALTLHSRVAEAATRPNVLLIITDDQGYGDLGLHGNDKIRTPNLDRLGRESVQFTQFLVSPVCSPTRASLLTGRYNYRTGVVDTFLGRSLMWPDEVTLAEILSGSGYRTGLFGKWHLGDNYPMRANDQGFHEVLVGRGGGLGQPSDEPGTVRERAYFDPVLQHNSRPVKFNGYCTDIFADATIGFIEQHREMPFFAMLALNAPHDPLQVPDEYLKPYLDAGIPERTARVYAMITNLDHNIGRVLARTRELDLEKNTIVIFMTDNGPSGQRFNGGMRGAKGTIYEGGIRVPFFVKWPGQLRPAKVDRMSAHIDVLPTLLDLCSVSVPTGLKIDGRSLAPLLRDHSVTDWPDRTVHLQWHRGDNPELFRQSVARTQKWKLVNGKELYDLEKDPAETTDVSANHPEIMQRLRGEHQAWFTDVTARCAQNPSRIVIGSEHENPVLLTRQDWRGREAGWTPKSVGYWELQVAGAGAYSISALAAPAEADRKLRIRVGDLQREAVLPAKSDKIAIEAIELPSGPARLYAEVGEGGQAVGVNYVRIERKRAE
jgi:arylsulfatase A-like enzyme